MLTVYMEFRLLWILILNPDFRISTDQNTSRSQIRPENPCWHSSRLSITRVWMLSYIFVRSYSSTQADMTWSVCINAVWVKIEHLCCIYISWSKVLDFIISRWRIAASTNRLKHEYLWNCSDLMLPSFDWCCD